MATAGDSAEVRLHALDTDVTVELRGPGAAEVASAVVVAWARCLRDDDSPGVAVVVELTRDSDRRAVLERLSPQVTQAVIEARAGQLVMLHAAGLADPRTGATWALVGPSGMGKTTAARFLSGAYSYLTDETVGIRSDGTIAPYPKPLSVRYAGEPFKAQEPAPEAPPFPPGYRLAGLLVLDRDGSETTVVEELSVVRGLAALAPETSFLSRLPRPLHLLAGHIERAGGVRVVRYREAAQVGEAMATLRNEVA